MGIINREGALYMATGIDNTGLYSGRREAMGIIKAMASQITSFDIFSGIGLSAATAFASAAKDAYNFEKEFRKNMLEVATISAQIGGSMTENMNKVMAITQQIPISAPEAAKALYQIVSAGHDGADGMKILEVAAKSAVGGLTDTATAADAITTILNAYKLSADHAANISDQLFTTVRLGKTDFGQLGTSIAQVAPIAAAYGIGIDEVLGAVASLTKQGVPTSQAMTQIRAAVQGASKELGDAAFQGRTFQEALQLITEKAGGSASKIKEMLGTDEGLAATLALTGKNAKAAASDLGELQNSVGATNAAFEKMKEDVDNQLKLLSNNVHAALRPFGEALLKEASEIAQAFNEAFADGRAEAALKNLGDLVVIVGGAFIGYKGSVIASTLAQRLNVAVLRQAVLERQMEKVALLNGVAGHQALTAAQLKQVAARKLLTSTIKTQTAALAKNTVAMLSNPYLLAAAALSTLGYVLYKNITVESEFEKANKRLANTNSEVEKSLISEISKLNSLEKQLVEAKEGTEEYDRIRKTIVSNYGQYYKGLDGEIERVGNLSTVYSKLVENIRLSIGQRKFESFFNAEQENLDRIIEKKLNKAYNALIEKYGKDKGLKLYQQLFDNVIRGVELSNDALKDLKMATFSEWGFDNSPVGFASRSVLSLTWDINTAKLASEKALDELKKKYQITEDDITRILTGNDSSNLKKGKTEEKALTILQRKIDLTKKLSEAEANLKKLRSPSSTASQAEIDEAQKKVDELKKKLKDLTGLTETESDKRLKSQSELSRLILDSELKLQSARISIMEEGKDKRVALAMQEYSETLAQIEKERQAYKQKVKESGNPEDLSVLAGFDDRRTAAKDKRDSDIAIIARDTLKSFAERQREMTSIFLTEEEKRVASIKNRYEKEREWAKKAFKTGDIDTEEQYRSYLNLIDAAEQQEILKDLLNKYQDYAAQRTEIEKNFNAEIATLEKNRTADNSAEIDRAIAEIKKRQIEALSHINLSELQENIDWSGVFGNLDKLSTDTLSSLKDKLKTYLKDAADSISKDDFKTVTDALDQMDQALANRKPFDGLKEGFNEYKLACQDVAAAQKTVNDLVKQGDTSSYAYKKALANLTQAQDKRRNSLVKMSQAANQIGEKGGELVQTGNNIVGMLTDLGIEVPESVGKTLDGIGQVMSGLASIDLTKPFSVLTSATSIIGGIGKTIGGIFGFSSKKTVPQEIIDSYGDLMEILDDVISKQKEFLDNMAGTGAVSQYKKVQDLIDKQVEATMRLGKARLAAGSSAGSHSYGVRARRALEPYKKELKNIGIDLDKMDGRVTQLFELDPEILQKFRSEYFDVWLKIDADARDYLETLIQLGDDTKDLAEQTNEALTGISFDSARNELKNFLLDTDATMADVAENFEDYMRQAIVNTIIDDTMQNQIRAWYDQFTAAMGEKKDANGNLIEKAGILTEKEKRDLQDLYNQIFQDAANMRDNAYEAAGIEDKKDSSRQSSAKSIAASITQESADALNGNFNAQLIYSNKTAEGVASLKEQLGYIYKLQLSGWQDVKEIRKFADTISGNTERINKVAEQLSDIAGRIENNTKSTANNTQDIISKGIYIKR